MLPYNVNFAWATTVWKIKQSLLWRPSPEKENKNRSWLKSCQRRKMECVLEECQQYTNPHTHPPPTPRISADSNIHTLGQLTSNGTFNHINRFTRANWTKHLRLSGKGRGAGFPHSPNVCISCSLICPKGLVMSLPSFFGKEPRGCVFVVMFLMACWGTDLEFAEVKVIPSSVPRKNGGMWSM